MALYYETKINKHGLIDELTLYKNRTIINGKPLLLGTICHIYLMEDSIYGAKFVLLADKIVMSNLYSLKISCCPDNIIRLAMYPNSDRYNYTGYITLPKRIANRTIKELKEVLKKMIKDKETYKIILNTKERIQDDE